MQFPSFSLFLLKPVLKQQNKTKQNNGPLKYSTSLMQNSPYPQAVRDLLPRGLSACALRPILKAFILLSFYLLIIPCTLPLVNWIFLLVVLNFLSRCFSRWNSSDPPWGGALSFTFSWSPESLENLWVQHCLLNQTAYSLGPSRQSCLRKMLLEAVTLLRLLKVSLRILVKLYYITKKYYAHRKSQLQLLYIPSG